MSKDPNSTYYDAGGMEVLDIIKSKLTPQQYQGFLLGNVIKYSCRMNHKGTFNRDAQKCAFYARELATLNSAEDDLEKSRRYETKTTPPKHYHRLEAAADETKKDKRKDVNTS